MLWFSKFLEKFNKTWNFEKRNPPIFYTDLILQTFFWNFDFFNLINNKIALQFASNKMASKCVDVENDDDDEQPEDDEAEDKEEGDSVRTASTTVASLWTSHQTHRRLLQKHFLVNL